LRRSNLVEGHGDCHAEFTLSYARFFAEPVLSNTRSFPFTSFRVRMTGGEGLRMTQSEGLAMTVGELANDLKLLEEYKCDKMWQVKTILSLAE